MLVTLEQPPNIWEVLVTLETSHASNPLMLVTLEQPPNIDVMFLVSDTSRFETSMLVKGSRSSSV